MKITKRNGDIVDFDKHKISKALRLANGSLDDMAQRIPDEKITALADRIEQECFTSVWCIY